MIKIAPLNTLFLTLSSAVLCAQVQANDIYLDANPNTAHARFDATHSTKNLRFSVAAMITDDKGSLATAGAWTYGTINPANGVEGGIGAKAYLIDAKDDNFAALGLGGLIRFPIPGVNGLDLTSELFYAPSITISNEVDNLVDFTVRLRYELFENGAVYAGFRRFQSDMDGRDYEFDDGLHAGIQFSI